MRLPRVLIWACLTASFVASIAGQEDVHPPRLLFTAQRLKRLKREQKRQTPRWINLEERIKTVADSPERGFELALYYAITGEQARATQVEQWAKSHPCEIRQVAIIRDVLATVTLSPENCPPAQTGSFAPGPIGRMRDSLFARLADDKDPDVSPSSFLKALAATDLSNAAELYAAVEYVSALRNARGTDVRQDAAQFFNSLPVQFLLSLKPAQVEHPDWQAHITALALIGLDPNSDSSQFLQGWAIEDRQMVRDGPGVAYELLWADSYLPGVGYQNMDPWFYDEGNARLLARTDWSLAACTVKISAVGVDAFQCPTGWQSKRLEFGRMELIPMTEQCVQLSPRPNNASAFLWKLPPNGHLKASDGGKTVVMQADRAGLWRVPSNVAGKVCSVR